MPVSSYWTATGMSLLLRISLVQFGAQLVVVSIVWIELDGLRVVGDGILDTLLRFPCGAPNNVVVVWPFLFAPPTRRAAFSKFVHNGSVSA